MNDLSGENIQAYTEVENVQSSQHTMRRQFITYTGLLAILLGAFKIYFDSNVLITGLLYVYRGIPNPPQPGFAVTIIVYVVCLVYIILGKRIIDQKDKNVRTFIRILTFISIILTIYETLRPNLFAAFIAALVPFLVCADILIGKILKSEEFKKSLYTPNYYFNIPTTLIYTGITILLVIGASFLERKIYPPVIWVTYQDMDHGFQISYPSWLRSVNSAEHRNGTREYLMPEAFNRIIEIADVISTTTKPYFRGYMNITSSLWSPESSEDMVEKLKMSIAQRSSSPQASTTPAVYEEITLGNQKFYSLLYLPTAKRENYTRQIYVFVPAYDLFGIHQPSRVLLLEYTPANYPIFQEISSTLKMIPIVPTDEGLWNSISEHTDISWCDHMDNEEMRYACRVQIRGYPIVEKYPLNLDMILGQDGTVEIIGTSTLKISTSKLDSNATQLGSWIMFATTTGEGLWAINFDATFENSEKAESLLSMYWGDEKIGSIDGRMVSMSGDLGPWFFASTTKNNSLYPFGFRLDSFVSAGTTSVIIKNIRAESFR
ncbi:MAG: hypothetical protein AAB381_02430 [Patescibacteria group bacterium]